MCYYSSTGMQQSYFVLARHTTTPRGYFIQRVCAHAYFHHLIFHIVLATQKKHVSQFECIVAAICSEDPHSLSLAVRGNWELHHKTHKHSGRLASLPRMQRFIILATPAVCAAKLWLRGGTLVNMGYLLFCRHKKNLADHQQVVGNLSLEKRCCF